MAKACPKLVREARASVIRLRVSIARLRLRISLTKHLGRGSVTKHLSRSIADEEKKKKHSVEYFFLDGL